MSRERELVAVVDAEIDDGGSETGSGAPAKSARTLELALGVQIRLFRRQHDLSVSDLAGAAGISTGMLSKIENGQISPSLSTLQAIAAALGTPISSLFSTFEDRQDCSFVKAKQGAIIERRGTKSGHVYELLGHALGGQIAVEPFLITLQKDAAPHTSFQHALGFVSDEAVAQIALGLNLSRADVHGVVTFYHDFRHAPAGRTVVKLCQAEACQARGGRAVTAHAEACLGVKLGQSTADGAVTLEPIYCLGLCASGPAGLVGDQPVARLDAARVELLLDGVTA